MSVVCRVVEKRQPNQAFPFLRLEMLARWGHPDNIYGRAPELVLVALVTCMKRPCALIPADANDFDPL